VGPSTLVSGVGPSTVVSGVGPSTVVSGVAPSTVLSLAGVSLPATPSELARHAREAGEADAAEVLEALPPRRYYDAAQISEGVHDALTGEDRASGEPDQRGERVVAVDARPFQERPRPRDQRDDVVRRHRRAGVVEQLVARGDHLLRGDGRNEVIATDNFHQEQAVQFAQAQRLALRRRQFRHARGEHLAEFLGRCRRHGGILPFGWAGLPETVLELVHLADVRPLCCGPAIPANLVDDLVPQKADQPRPLAGPPGEPLAGRQGRRAAMGRGVGPLGGV